MPTIASLISKAMNWMAANARTFSYALPDSVEFLLYVAIGLYLAMEISQIA